MSRQSVAIELANALAEFGKSCPGWCVTVTYEVTPEVFSITQDELNEGDPFAWPHQYRVRLTKLWLGWQYPVMETVVADVPGTVRAIIEGVELGVAEHAMIDWVWSRIAVSQV